MPSAIEWTDETWNPTTGCTKVSPGCAHCYIERTIPFRKAGRKFVTGKIPVELHPDRLDKPLHWRKPRRVFVNSLSDLFHEDVPDEFIRRCFAVMSLSGQHTFQVLTKRPMRMVEFFAESSLSECQAEYCVSDNYPLTPTGRDRVRDTRSINGNGGNRWPLPNVWLGTSVEDQKRADERIPHLLRCPAAVRFLSCEPLLGDVNFMRILIVNKLAMQPPRSFHRDDFVRPPWIDWVIAGGESGPGARPMHPDWVRSIRDQCAASHLPFFFKQWGEWAPRDHCGRIDARLAENSLPAVWQDGVMLCRVGKKAAGRLLDGVEHSAFPSLNPQLSTLNSTE